MTYDSGIEQTIYASGVLRCLECGKCTAICPMARYDGGFSPRVTVGRALVNRNDELLDDDRHTLAVTLFRAMRNRICTEWRSSGNFPLQNGGQCLRTLEYEYAVYPHTGDWRKGNVYAEAMALNAPPAVFQCSPNPSSAADLPPAASFFAVEGLPTMSF